MDELRARLDRLERQTVRTRHQVRALLALWAATLAGALVVGAVSTSPAQSPYPPQTIPQLRVDELAVGRLRMPIGRGGAGNVVTFEWFDGLRLRSDPETAAGIVLRMQDGVPAIIFTDRAGRVVWRAP